MICDNKLEELINETDDISRVDRAIQYAEDQTNLQRMVRRARITGKYSLPENRISMYLDRTKELIDKHLYVEELDTYERSSVKIKTAKMVGEGKVSINDGKYIVDLDNNTTTDYRYLVEVYGSEPDMDTKNTLKLQDLTGTVRQDLGDIMARLSKVDGEALSESHREHLARVLDIYTTTLEVAGKDVELNVELFTALDNRNTRGNADPATGKMKLIFGSKKHRTASEIMTHELQHVLIEKAINKAPGLRVKIAKLRDSMAKEMDYKVFLEGITDVTSEDTAYAKELYDYVFNNTVTPESEFLAFATTNEAMVNKLGSITSSKNIEWMSQVKETGLITKLWNSIVKAINTMYSAKQLSKGSAEEIALDLLDAAMELAHNNEVKEEKNLFYKGVDKISVMDKNLAKYTGVINKEHSSYAEFLADQKEDKMSMAIDALWRIKGLSRARSWALQNNLFNSVTRNLNNPDVSKFYEMFRHSKAFIEREVVSVKQKTAQVLEEKYELGKMSKGLREASKRILIDLDAGVLGDIAEIRKYLDDDKLLQKEFDEITKDYHPSTLEAVDVLADMLVTNKMKTRNGYVNAAQIAFGTINSLDDTVIDQLDKAITLAAIAKADKGNKELTVKAIDANAFALDRVLSLKKADQAKVLETAYGGDRMYEVKGSKQEAYIGNKKHYIVDEKEMRGLVKAKMENLGKHKELSRIIGRDVYLVVGESLDVGYSEGLMSTVQLKNEGDSLRRIVMEMTEMEEAEIKELIRDLSTEQGNAEESLVPERSSMNTIYDYRVRLPHEVKSKYLDVNDDIVATTASTVSNLTRKQEAMMSNRSALHYLYKFHDKYKASKEYKFVEISSKSKGKKEKEYWDIIPYYLKKEVEKRGGTLYVEEGMLVDFFGYQDVSLKNLPFIKDSKARQLWVRRMEKIVQEIIKRWKHQLVVMTPSTIKGNMTSNMIIAMQHTKNKNPLKYAEKYKEVWEMLNKYQSDRSAMIELQVRKDAGEVINDRDIEALKAKMRSNPVNWIMEDGQYNAIMEDITTDLFDVKGPIEGKIDELISKVKKDKNREGVKTLIDNVYIRKDAKIHDSIMKLTVYSDAINKMIILMDMVEADSIEKPNQQMLNYVDSLHVNYAYLDNRYVKYANDAGFLTFTKYLFRIMPAMAKMMGTKMITVFTTESLIAVTGIGETPLEQWYNPIDSVMTKAGLIGDPGSILENVVTPAWFR